MGRTTDGVGELSFGRHSNALPSAARTLDLALTSPLPALRHRARGAGGGPRVASVRAVGSYVGIVAHRCAGSCAADRYYPAWPGNHETAYACVGYVRIRETNDPSHLYHVLVSYVPIDSINCIRHMPRSHRIEQTHTAKCGTLRYWKIRSSLYVHLLRYNLILLIYST